MTKKIDNKVYYQVAGWMINDLHLTGQELICYAIIYSLSQLGQGRYNAGLEYLSTFMQCSQPTASKALKGLQAKKLIDKEEVITDYGRRVLYYCTNPDEKGDEKDTNRGVNKKFMDGVNKKFISNNINNKEDNSINKKELSSDNSKKTKEGSLFSNVTDEKEKNYLEYMYEHYPLIMKMDKPLTYAEFKTLRENFDVDLVWDKMDNLENTKNMRKKYVSAYLTLNNWCKMSFNRESKKKEDEQ